ncbi:MAG TPA: voltage-gated chloride channel family protein [Polyangiaceae bacterium]|jgi:H+/Cl- antiporter ClcA
MNFRRRAQIVLQWIALGCAVGIACGLASAVFLLALDRATRFRIDHEVIVYTLPLAGVVIGLVYQRWGQSIKGGNNLVLDTIHELREQIPLRMAPMVLLGTVLTHLFGGSAGREGTAVQMGASLADAIAHRFRLHHEGRRQLLAAGIAGGFGSVFGTPIAGMIFGLEVVWVGRVEYHALLPALVASIVGDVVTRGCGVVHTRYPTVAFHAMTPMLAAKWIVFGLAVAMTATAFVELTHRLKRLLEQRIPPLPLRMLLGGAAVVLLWKLIGTSDYLGLGVPTIVRAFDDPSVPPYAFAAKLVFTSVTLASGFLGGEVTPLFFIGATLGAALGRVLGLPIDLAAGVGLAGVFAAAANTPIALSIMAVELLGASVMPHVVIVCVIAYLLTGHRGIYPAQRLTRFKTGHRALPSAVPLREAHDVSNPDDHASSRPPPSRSDV